MPEITRTPDQPPAVAPGFMPVSRVLVVDDAKDSCDALAMLLQLSGYRVSKAYDGVAALTMAAEFRPQAVVLDLRMPKMDGLTLARELRTLPEAAGARIVAISGLPVEESSELAAAIQAQIDRFVKKPVSLHQLLVALGEKFG